MPASLILNFMDQIIYKTNRSTPTMAEQDFIILIRRMHRLNMDGTIINLIRHINDYNSGDADGIEGKLRDFVQSLKGEMHSMVNGDVMMILPAMSDKQINQVQDNLLALAFSGVNMPVDQARKEMVLYKMPADYMQLRVQANSYVELARASEMMGPLQQAVRALQDEDVRGPLTAWSLAQAEKLIDNIDIKRYVRTQPVYHQGDGGVWCKSFIDFYISMGDLKRERFPKLVLDTPERLFLELCYTLDRKLLQELSQFTDNWLEKSISINLSAETVLSSAFAQFCHILPRVKRGNVVFDIHRSDLFLNFSTTRNAIKVLKEEGFLVGIDGITPSVLPYINFGLLQADFFKINVTKEKWPEMNEPSVKKSFETLPVDKIILSHCDHEEALKFGQRAGVRHYQGWLIDDVAHILG
jgi:hypothetical protein